MPVRCIERSPSAYAYPLLIKNLLKPALNYAPDQEIVDGCRSRRSYRQLAERVARLAGALGDLGIGAGQTVAVMGWDSPLYLECYFAVPMIGAILHTLNIRLAPDQLAYTIEHADDDLILVHADFLPLLASVRDRLARDRRIVVFSEGQETPETPLAAVADFEALLARQSPDYIFPDFDENAAATLFYTTGTTGLPKGVSFSHRQIVLHTYGFLSGLCAFRSFTQVDSGDVYMPLTPMFHVHAWGMPYLFTMLGAKQVYPGKFDPKTILRLIRDERVTFSHCVPTILHMLLSHPTSRDCDLRGWKVVIGGSALPKGLCTHALERGIQLVSAYGMSETGPLLTIANPRPHMLGWEPDRQVDVRCRTGLPVPLVDLEIVDPEGHPLPRDGRQRGEVVVRSPWLAQAYVKAPDQSEALWRDGWLHTGDVGYVDADGYLRITDRLKDVIKTGGEWVSSLELEDILSGHTAVSEAAIIGVPDDQWGERPLALVVLRGEFHGRVTAGELQEVFREQVAAGRIPKYGVPDQILLVEEIAKTSVGKLDKKRLREQYGRCQWSHKPSPKA